jgi:class 3 adenylate cyclase
VATENPEDLPRLKYATAAMDDNVALNDQSNLKCPMSGMVINTHCVSDHADTATLDTMSVTEYSLAESNSGRRVARNSKKSGPFSGGCSGRGESTATKLSNSSNHSKGSRGSTARGSFGSGDEGEVAGFEAGSLSSSTTRQLFPYHVVIDQDFAVVQAGIHLAKVLGTNENVLYNYDIDEVFTFVQPKPAKWTRSWMRKLEDQEFILQCSLSSAPTNVMFKGTLVATNPGEAMLVLCPEANNLEELREMKLTMSDLPAHGAYRNAIFLREHLSKQLNNALKMEKLSMTLQTEKELLESLLPQHAAEGLRKGQTVEPRIHNNATMFFSDIGKLFFRSDTPCFICLVLTLSASTTLVGFTNICKHIPPTEVVEMLNRLYMVMDYLAKKFNCFKVETIGDAYVAASGLPDADVNHAVNIANFAVAVNHCCRKVLSPLDASPINLRIGVNSGRCASGIVGVTNPRYCVFGDTVNTTARHESTGEPGKVHSSMTTMIELLKRANDEFVHDSRGMVEMKGKGAIPTYWLSSSEDNQLTNKAALKQLEEEIMKKFGDKLAQEEIISRRKKKKKAAGG